MRNHASPLPVSTDPWAWAIDLLLLAGLGFASTLSWLAVCVVCETREAWDSFAYFAVVLPILWSASAVAGWRRPRHAWRWAAAILAGQALGLGITNHGFLTLGPLALVALAVLLAPCFFSASLAAGRRRRK